MRFVFVFFILANNVCSCRSNTRFVDYTVVGSPSIGKSARRVSCAKACADNRYLAARVNVATGNCEGLTWDWGSDPQYEAGFSYIRKTETVEIYDPVLRLENKYQWLIPGSFDAGARLQFYITIPTGDWTGFNIDILDSTESSYSVYEGESEVVMVHIMMLKSSNSIIFKAWWFGWTNKKTLSPSPFADGGTYKITIAPHASDMQILFDDVEVVRYPNPTDPSTAKQLTFSPWENTILQLSNITFVGI